MAVQKGRGVRLEVSKTLGADKTVTAVTLADPGVATCTAHGLSDGAVGHFHDVTGMAQLEGQAVRVNAPTTNDFALEGLDTSGFPAYTGGKLAPVTAWSTISNSVDIQFGGGDAEKLDATTLLDVIKKEENGLLAAETATVNVLADPQLEASGINRKAALAGGDLTYRVTFSNGEQIVWRGQPSVPGFNLQKGQLATGSFGITVKGQVMYLPAV